MEFWYSGRTAAVVINGNLTGQTYIDTILNSVVAPNVRQHKLKLQHDNARSHTSKVAQEAINALRMKQLEWPACLPDLSPSKHVWDIMQRQMTANENPPTSLNQLFQQVLAI